MASRARRPGPEGRGGYTPSSDVSTAPRDTPGGEVHRLSVGPALRGERLDRAIAASLPELSRSRVQALLEAGRILVDGRPGRASVRLKGGETLEVSVPPPEPAVPE